MTSSKRCRAGRTDTATPFEYGARLTEFRFWATWRSTRDRRNWWQWDGPNMKVTNIPELNQWLKREDRKGWTV